MASPFPVPLLRAAPHPLVLAVSSLLPSAVSAQSVGTADALSLAAVLPWLMMGAGAVAGCVLGMQFGRQRRKPADARSSPPTPTPTPTPTPETTPSRAGQGSEAQPPETWRDFVELSADWPWETDSGLRFIAIADAPPPPAAAPEGTPGRRWEEVILPELPPEQVPSHLDALERRADFIITLTRPGASGEPCYLEMRGRAMFDTEGRFRGYRGVGRDLTAEAAARAACDSALRNAAGWQTLFDASPASIGRLDAEGRWLQVNPALAESLGQPAATLAGTVVDACLEADDAAAGKTLRARCLAGEIGRYDREARWRDAAGALRWCRESVRLLPAEADAAAGFILALEDISGLRQAVDGQRAGEARYRQLFELSPEATLVCIDGRIHLANAAARRLFGVDTAHSLEGVDLLSLVHPEDHAMESSRLQQFAANPEQASLAPLPLRYRRLDGTTIDAEATGMRLDLDGSPALLYVLRDVARWLLAEQVLRESRAMYRDVVESVNEILFQTDGNGRISFLNRAWHHTTGFDGRLSIGQHLLAFVADDDRKRVEQRLRGIHDGLDAIAEFEFRLRTHSEGPRWVEATIRPLRDPYDHVVGCSGTLDDITARKAAEQSQRDLNRELEARVRVRTAELEASNRELEAFSYSVSHDLRAPLRAIDGFAQIVAEDYAPRLDDTGREYLQRIRVATQKIARLIDDLIDLARLTRQAMSREPVNLSQVVEQIVAELRQEDPSRKIEIHIEPQLVAAADRALIRVALENLLRNAWKFTSRREVAKIGFHAERRDREIVYCVTDNGAGFDMTFASKLFLPFHRLHGITEFAGTGIGLATVQRVIQRHEGRVWAQSAPDRGASFYFTLSH